MMADRTEPVTLTNMCMVQKDGKVLVLDRTDPAWPGLTFPGGHVEPGEPVNMSVVREIKEETGLKITPPRLCGLKQFNDAQNRRYIVFCYIAKVQSGKLRESAEGRLTWMTLEELKRRPLAEGFAGMLNIFCDEELTEYLVHYSADGERKEAVY